MARHWVNRYKRISTHALREEGDGRTHDRTRRHRISTHALREEGDANSLRFSLNAFIFLPTPSVRRATPLTRRSNGSADIFLPTPSARRATFSAELQLLRR